MHGAILNICPRSEMP